MSLPLRLQLLLLMACTALSACTSGSTEPPVDSRTTPSEDTLAPPADSHAPDVAGDGFIPWQPDVNPPELAVVETWLSSESLVAGESALTVTCMGYDTVGNYIGAGPCHLEAPAAVTVEQLTVTATQAGTYEVHCVPDNGATVELVPAAFNVVPAMPASLELSVKPDKEVYVIDNKLTLSGSGEDSFGNAIDEIPLAGLTILPASMGVIIGTDQVKLKAEGTATISAHAAGAPQAEDSFTVTVDVGPPKIVIESPERGAQLTGSGPVTVTGSVVDSTGLKKATLNGKSLSVGANGTFTTTINGSHGLNLLRVEAEDVLGNTSSHLQSFTLSSHYYPVLDGSLDEMLVPGGISVWLGSKAFKSSDPSGGTTLSWIAQEFLLAFDLDALIPSPASQQEILLCTYDIYLENLAYGDPVIELWPLPAGLQVHVKFPDLQADLVAPAPWCPDLSGQVTASAVTVDALAVVDLSPAGELTLEMENVDVQFVNLDIQLDGVTGALVGAVLGFFMDDLTVMMEEQFESEVKAQVESQLAGLLSAVYVDQWIELPPFMPTASSTLAEIHLRGSGLDSSYGGLEITLDAAFTAVDKKHLDLTGALARDGCLGGPPAVPTLPGQHYLEVALHDDVLNQSVFAKFLAGGVDFVLDGDDLAAMGNDLGQYGVEDLQIVAKTLLPPVLSDCHPDGKFRIQLGEMELHISLTMLGMPLEMVMILYFSTTASFELAGTPGNQQVLFTFDEVDWTEYHIAEINEEWEGKEALFGQLIEETFLAEFVSVIQDFPYTIQVSQMPVGDFLPAFAGWTFVPVIDTVTRKNGYWLFTAHLLLEQ